ncbi:uncharacterized protein LOC116262115 isoform X1 [Nymphaea colorata]|nr:uncharacterized protein LOC116262115 isoform X1 [Nymphaea colorata]
MGTHTFPSEMARCFGLSTYGYILLVFFLSSLLGVVLSAAYTVKNHVPPSSSKVEDAHEFTRFESHSEKDVGLRHIVLGDVSSNHVHSNLQEGCGSNNFCRNLEQFCFQSTLPTSSIGRGNHEVAFSSQASQLQNSNLLMFGGSHLPGENNLSMNFDHFSYKLLNGRGISCSVSSMLKQHDIENGNSFVISTSGSPCDGYCGDTFNRTSSKSVVDGLDRAELNAPVSVHAAGVVVSPPSLDWGLNYLLTPSHSYLTVTNTHNDSAIYIHEPFSTDPQFYAYGFEERMLTPGQSISITFVFLPRLLGFSSAKLILQTSAGGFIVHAKGKAIESPYRVRPLVFQNVLAGRSSRKLSLYNPFDVDLYVGELTAWFSVTIGNVTHSAHAACQKIEDDENCGSYLNDQDWIIVRSFSPPGLPILQVRPSGIWEIGPGKSESIIEFNPLLPAEGGIFGAICVSLWNLSHDQVQKIIVPFEAETSGRVFYTDCLGSLCVSLESLVLHGNEEPRVFSVSLKNDASHLLKVTKIREVTEGQKHFYIKYAQGLVLFSQTVTRIANVIYSLHTSPENAADEISMIGSNCKLLIVTNASVNPEIEIPCKAIFEAFSIHQIETTASAFDNFHSIINCGNSGFAGSRAQTFSNLIHSQSLIKGSDIAKADECILNNWISQRTAIGMSVLGDTEILFPIVHVGAHCSKWITVKNPSQKPVVMQLVLNSGVIIDQCTGIDDLLQHALASSSTKYEASTKSDGFFISEVGISEAYVYPNESALLGPISFRPSNHCVWRSSVLIRNNLTGTEWLPLHGSGGLASLVLLEGSKPVQSLEFDFGYPLSLNVSPSEKLLDMKSTSATCARPLLKVLYAKNAGDMPLEVTRIDISGTGCGSDGFTVDTCEGFTLQPGETMRLLVSYQTDFSASVVHRDLELAYSTGVLVIPMRATFPAYMLSLCRRSFFWMLLQKVSLVVLVAASATFLVFFRIVPQATTSEGDECLGKYAKRAISSLTKIGKAADSHQGQRSFRLTNPPASTIEFDHHDDTYKSQESETVSFQNVRWIQDNIVSSFSLPSYCDNDNNTRSSSSNSTSKSKCIVESSGLAESSPKGNLTVKTETGRGKRRKRRGAALAGKQEVSSSQSGNSTPSSPVSPLAPFTSSCPGSPLIKGSSSLDVRAAEMPAYALTETSLADSGNIEPKPDKFCGQTVLPSKQITENTSPELPCLSMSRKKSGRPVLLPSATFPTSGKHDERRACNPSTFSSSPSSPCLSQPSGVAPHARAPGSRLGKERINKQENENDGLAVNEGLVYDIWGNHFPEFQLMDSPGICSSKTFDISPDSQSFFAQTPQSHLQKFPY